VIPRNRLRQPGVAGHWASTTDRVVVPARQAGNRFLGSLKGLQIPALGSINNYKYGLSVNTEHAEYNPYNPILL